MFKQVKSALFWYYLYKFRKRVTIIVFLILLSIFANSIYSDVVQYLQLKDKLQYLELAFIFKWTTILSSLTISSYLVLTLFKKEEKEKEVKNEPLEKVEDKKQTQEEKIADKRKFTKREEMFLKKDTLNSEADILVKR